MKTFFSLIAVAALAVAALTPSVSSAQQVLYGNVTYSRNYVPPNTFNYVAGQNYTYYGTDGRVYSNYVPGHASNLENRPLNVVPSYPSNAQSYQNPRNVYYSTGIYSPSAFSNSQRR